MFVEGLHAQQPGNACESSRLRLPTAGGATAGCPVRAEAFSTEKPSMLSGEQLRGLTVQQLRGELARRMDPKAATTDPGNAEVLARNSALTKLVKSSRWP